WQGGDDAPPQSVHGICVAGTTKPRQAERDGEKGLEPLRNRARNQVVHAKDRRLVIIGPGREWRRARLVPRSGTLELGTCDAGFLRQPMSDWSVLTDRSRSWPSDAATFPSGYTSG